MQFQVNELSMKSEIYRIGAQVKGAKLRCGCQRQGQEGRQKKQMCKHLEAKESEHSALKSLKGLQVSWNMSQRAEK